MKFEEMRWLGTKFVHIEVLQSVVGGGGGGGGGSGGGNNRRSEKLLELWDSFCDDMKQVECF